MSSLTRTTTTEHNALSRTRRVNQPLLDRSEVDMARGGRGGGRGGKSASRLRYLKQRDAADYNISGPGIFITCVRGKESRAVVEARDMLERASEELGILFTEIEKPSTEVEVGLASKDDEEDGLDEGPIEGPSGENGHAQGAINDFEAEMQRELRELGSKEERPSKRRKVETSEGNETKKPKKDGFRSKTTDCECLCFLTVPEPADPVQLVSYIVAATHQGRRDFAPRYIQRCTPVAQTSGATLGEVSVLARRVLPPIFGPERTMTGPSDAGIKYRIEPSTRHHTAPLNRSNLITSVAEVVASLAAEPPTDPSKEREPSPPAFPPPPPPTWKHKVDIDHAELVVLVTVFKNIVGISVVRAEEYDGKGKKWNLRAIAEAQEKVAASASATKTAPVEDAA